MGVKNNELKNIENVFDLIVYVSELNADIRKRNEQSLSGKKEKELNLSYILKRYEKIKKKEEIAEFRELHECKYCMYFDKPRRCMAIDTCPIERDFPNAKKTDERPILKCPRYDKDVPCPYGNEAGTCFGFCTKEVIEEMKMKRMASERMVSANE